jgi:hypothetical protein
MDMRAAFAACGVRVGSIMNVSHRLRGGSSAGVPVATLRRL